MARKAMIIFFLITKLKTLFYKAFKVTLKEQYYQHRILLLFYLCFITKWKNKLFLYVSVMV